MREFVSGYATQRLAALAFAGLTVASSVFSGAIAGGGGGPDIVGPARVVDGDTIVIGAVRIRLEGIDAPESDQTCGVADGKGSTWRCGDTATTYLAKLVRNQDVRCQDLGLEKYGRTLGRCFVGGLNLNSDLVRQGLAWAFVRYSSTYVADEAHARGLKIGIWQGEAMPAWEFRAGQWAQAEPAAPGGCAIKGNVTAHGLIYHTPWSPWYGKVRMDSGHGKRWFCSEAEAIAAGWRPALTR